MTKNITKKIYVLATLIIISLVLCAYLSSDFYAVQYGTTSGDSICSINDVFNCEVVAASKYSSLFLGIPNALLGFMLNLVMLIALFGMLLSSGEKERSESWAAFFGGLSLINFSASVVMASIALFAMNVYCIFCMGLYALSTAIFFFFIFAFKVKPCPIRLAKEALKSKTLLMLLIFVPAASLLSHSIIKNDYSPAAQEKEINAAIRGWKTKPLVDFSELKPLFVLNPGAKVKVVEFADFLCPHCSKAASALKSFGKTHRNMELSFYAYPLDPSCNKNFDPKSKGPGFACTLAGGVLCAQKQGKGVSLHYDIFENQNYYRKVAMSGNNEALITQMSSALKDIDLESWETCISEATTTQTLIDSAKLGKSAGVQGTPTIFVNGRKLNGGANFLVLKAAYQELD